MEQKVYRISAYAILFQESLLEKRLDAVKAEYMNEKAKDRTEIKKLFSDLSKLREELVRTITQGIHLNAVFESHSLATITEDRNLEKQAESEAEIEKLRTELATQTTKYERQLHQQKLEVDKQSQVQHRLIDTVSRSNYEAINT